MDVSSVIGAYRLIKQIGSGGMGAVWLAQHEMLGRRAAIKVLHPMYSTREDVVTRFFNEARAATAISDPGIVQIFDFGHHTDGSAYIVMELLDGETLDQRLQGLGRLPVEDALRILRQVASSLGAAHAHGIVHRDLKPENIFLVRDLEVPGGERAKILDFGIAKLTVEQGGVKTQTSAMMGTPLFMSPEQCRGAGGVDQRSDIYALGCVLLTLVTGRPPFEAAGMGEILAMHMFEPAPRASSRVPDVPPMVDDLIAQCLDKDPARRFRSGTELALAIGKLLGHRVPTPLPFHALEQRPAVAPATTLSGSSMAISSASPASPTRSGGRRGIAIASVIALPIAGLGTWAAMRAPSSAATEVAPSPQVDEPATGSASMNDGDAKLQLAAAHIRSVLIAFTRWAPSHPGAPCPSVADLASVLGDAHAFDDPWGHPVTITCTDQPAGQIIGVISAGPDGLLDTADDMTSWTLGRDASAMIQGARWSPTAALSPVPDTISSPPVTKPASRPTRRPPKTRVPSAVTATSTTAAERTAPAAANPPPPTTHAGSAVPATSPAAPTPLPPTANGGIPRTR